MARIGIVFCRKDLQTEALCSSKQMRFVEEAENLAHTENSALAHRSTQSPTLDLFYAVGASRGQNIVPLFAAALAHCREDAVRIALWSRDTRGGAGERKLFRDMLVYTESMDMDLFKRMAAKVPMLGRWDDVLAVETADGRAFAAELVRRAIEEETAQSGRSLAAKWMPRKGEAARRLAHAWDMTPREYRKYLVESTDVVETRMCAGRWGEIAFEAVPSLALARYASAFKRHDGERFGMFVELVRQGTARVNAGAVYPYDVLKTLRTQGKEVAEEQWKALPDYLHSRAVIPMVDVSGSMLSSVGTSTTCMDIAVSLGLYIATRQKGPFGGLLLTFHSEPAFTSVRDIKTLEEQVAAVTDMPWGYNTDICRAFDLILSVAKRAGAGREDMPQTLVILSDMEFDVAATKKSKDCTVYEAYSEKFLAEGYERPAVVFWNLQSRNRHVPVRADETGAMLVSGFSPSLMKLVVGGDPSAITPLKVMESVIRDERYNF